MPSQGTSKNHGQSRGQRASKRVVTQQAQILPAGQWIKRTIAAAFLASVGAIGLAQLKAPFTVQAVFGQDSRQSLSVMGDDPEVERKATKDDCDFLRNPEGLKGAQARHRAQIAEAAEMVAPALAQTWDEHIALVPPAEIPRKNFIDDVLFATMAKDNIQSAPICSDEEFVRRAYLDITGRIPGAADVSAFLADKGTNKRNALIDKLIGSPEYVDKWTMFFGDLYKNTARSTNVVRYEAARYAFYEYLKNSVATNKPYTQIARELITANGDNFEKGEVNWIVGGRIPMGPNQDTMDGTVVNAANMFLGINAVDCILCHDGAGHLDQVNLWGSTTTRLAAWQMSAFFARTQTQQNLLSRDPLYVKRTVAELNRGDYMLNTTTGNRPEREAVNGKNLADPIYIFGNGKPNTGENRREAFARLLTADKQFARAAVNYIWEKIMVEAFVSPSNTFDPARLDPSAKLPDGWTLQPTNAELLNRLADDFIAGGYDIRKLIATITKSSAYQLSAQYPGTWNLSMIPYYARKYVRRLDAEEIHDSITKATNLSTTYTIPKNRLDGTTYTVTSAMQLPDTVTPGGNVGSFLNSFIRGDRDVKPRSNEPAIMQGLNMMNNSFVMTRIHQNNAGSTVATLLGNAALTPTEIITQLYLSTLSRNPTSEELSKLTPQFGALSRRDATEAIQWALLNKVDFLFNY